MSNGNTNEHVSPSAPAKEEDKRIITKKGAAPRVLVIDKKPVKATAKEQVISQPRSGKILVQSPFDFTETFKSAFDYSGIGMAIVSVEGKILEVNNAVCNFSGYSRPELLQKSFLDLGHPDDNHTDVTLLHRMLVKLLNYYSLEKRYISKYNKILWGLHTVSKVCNKYGVLQYYVVQIVDISRRKELTDDVNRKNSELEATRTGLINKIKQMEELNHIVAHNLRGPANNINVLVEMLKDTLQPKKESGLKLGLDEIVEFLEEGSGSLLSSLNALMDLVQISMNKTIAHDKCDVRRIIGDILSQLNSSVYEKNALIVLDLNVEYVKYPKIFLESIFYNLISNALMYSSNERRPEIAVRTYSVEDKVLLSVKDNGLGIDLVKYGDRIFKLNQVFHARHNVKSKGVGLYITKVQIESFGGKITVKSKENEGAEFIVTL